MTDTVFTAGETPGIKEKTDQIGSGQIKKFMETLEKYKAGKKQTESRILASENWWKLRNSTEEGRHSAVMAAEGFKSASGWLHNVIASKHADAMQAMPEPNILPREEADRAEARILSHIIPCIFEQNQFESTYSSVMWQKLKTGTGVYKIVWDSSRLNGLGDIAIEKVNLLNIFWEPGITDIQKSRYLFHTELTDREVLEEKYPSLRGKLNGQGFVSARFMYDDAVSVSDKITVIECYYHKYVQGRQTVQYVKFAGDQVIYASENDEVLKKRGLYDHGRYPYVFDALFPVEGSPCGYGFVDLCRNPQTAIDLLNTSFIKNAMAGATPRYFQRADGSVNEEEFLDLTKAIVHTNGNMGEDSLRQISFSPLAGIYVSVLDRMIQELRETSGNTETSNGNVNSGVTAASAIAALQEASGKGSRDSTMTSYRAYSELVYFAIELIRQFYDLPRQFRIVGANSAEQFVTYTNAYLKAQPQGEDFGVDMGCRLPVFDIRVSPQKRNAYSTVTQNELALQFFKMGFFNPQLTDQALMCLSLMEFDGKEDVIQKVSQNGGMKRKLVQYQKLALMLAQKAAPEMVSGLSQDIMQSAGASPSAGGAVKISGGAERKTENARKAAASAGMPGGGR